MKKHFKQQVQTITAAYQSLDDTDYNKLLEECIKTIKGGHSIIATALGKNVPICEKFVGTLNSLGVDAHFMHTNSAVHGDLGIIKNNDLVIVLSKSGNTDETLYLCNLLQDRGSSNWLITCNSKGIASDLIDQNIVLEVKQEGDPWNLVPNNSTLVFLVFLQSLCMELIERLPVDLKTFKSNHPGGSIGKILAKNDE